MKKALLFLSFLAFFVTGRAQNASGAIRTIQIGTQTWMSENLNVDKFRNGDPIPEAKTNKEWKKAGANKQPAWCYYNNDPANGAKYGKLYNWYAVNDPRGLAPQGWHVPTDGEWYQLTTFLGDMKIAGPKMKAKNGWNKNGNGTNESGFSGLPGGLRYGYGGFPTSGNYGYWWSSTEFGTGDAWLRYLGSAVVPVFSYTNGKEVGLSVRCLRD